MPETFITFLASFLIFIIIFGLFVLWVIDGKIKKEQVAHAILACAVSWTIASLIKYFFPTIRPFLVDGNPVLTITIPQDGAFPSEHTTLAFAIAVTIFMHDRISGTFFLIAAFLVGSARVLANVHYPIDIAGGAFLGTIVAVLVEKIHLFKVLTFSRR